MSDTKLKLKDPGTIHLMALDTSSLFLPFGRPIADYVRGVVTPQNGSRALLNQGAIPFSPLVSYTASMAALLRTTGFGELERDGLAIPDVAPQSGEADPGVADFLSFDEPELATREAGDAKISPAIGSDDVSISLPRVSALPLRPRMTFGPAPASKTKAAPVAPQKPVAAPAAKAGPVVVPKASPPPPPPAPKPVAAPVPPSKVAAPTLVQPKPTPTVAPPAPAPVSKPTVIPVAKPVAPAARAAEVAPIQPKVNPTPVRTPVAPSRESLAPAVEPPAPVKPAPVAPKAPTPIATPKPPAPPVAAPPPPAPSGVNRAAGRSSLADTVEPPAREPAAKEGPKETREREPETRSKPAANLSLPTPSAPAPQISEGPNLSMGVAADSGGFLAKIPMPARLGIALVVVAVALYFVFGKSSAGKGSSPQTAVTMGEQGWSTEWASDTGGSKRGRQLTLYRPSTGMTDYQFRFVGQIESKALGWVFRAADTKNYYAMKIETLRPGVMAISHLAVVEGRESSYSQKPINIDARPGAAYRVTLDVNGPRFTINVNNEPVDFWTDNRLKAGAVGFMNERDERGASSSVQFSFPQRGR